MNSDELREIVLACGNFSLYIKERKLKTCVVLLKKYDIYCICVSRFLRTARQRECFIGRFTN